MPVLNNLIPLLARLILTPIFLRSGYNKIVKWDETARNMIEHRMPLVEPFFLPGAIFLELAGGLALLLGLKGRWGAAALIVFLIPTTLIFHNFLDDPRQIGQFLKNLGLLAGLLMFLAHDTGNWSLDRILFRRRSGATK
ncbi:MAG: DoxX family protein [Calditrichaeota bacterium]|nr:DoxX family protein [Calditrichota bacterium]